MHRSLKSTFYIRLEQSYLFDLRLPFIIFVMNLPSLTIFGHTLDELIHLDFWRNVVKRRALCILTATTIFCRTWTADDITARFSCTSCTSAP